MHISPTVPRQFSRSFSADTGTRPAERLVPFLSAVARKAWAAATGDRPGIVVGAQNIHWEDKGPFYR